MKNLPLDARRTQRRAAAWIVATVACGAAWAQSANEALNAAGIQAGPVIIAPSLSVGYAYDTNVLQQPTTTDPVPDEVLTLQPAVQLTVPFSNSWFRFGDVLTYVDYNKTPQTQGKTSNDAAADLTLNFASLDQLELSAHSVAGVAETLAFDLGGEIGFQGNNFTLHSQAAVFSRLLQGARGYRFGLEHTALRFDSAVNANFYNYRGFDGEASYFQPLSPNTRLAFGYLGSRYDHFSVANPSTVSRTENGDIVYGQFEGRFGPRQPYVLRLGWERLAFGGTESIAGGDFSGVVGQFNLSAIVGGGTTFTVVVQRQPYRSYDANNSYYVSNLAVGSVERLFHERTSVGGSLLFSINGYRRPSTEVDVDGETVTFYREDRRVQLEAHANIALAERVAFRVSFARNRRYSNASFANYNNTVVFGGFVFGWT